MSSKEYQQKCEALAKECSDKFGRNFKKFSEVAKLYCDRCCNEPGRDPQKVFNKAVTPDLLEIAMGYIMTQYQNEDIIRSFIAKAHAFAPQILQKDVEFLMKNLSTLIPLIPANYLEPLQKMAKILKPSEIDTIWNYLRAFLNDSVRYCFYSRVPSLENGKVSYKFPRFPNAYTHDKKCTLDKDCRGCPQCGKLIAIDLIKLGCPTMLDLKLRIPE